MAQFASSCLVELKRLESFSIELHTSYATSLIFRTLEEQEHCRTNLRVLSIIGQCDYSDASTILSALPELNELNLLSLVDPEDAPTSQALPVPALGLSPDTNTDSDMQSGVSSPHVPTSPTGTDEIPSPWKACSSSN